MEENPNYEKEYRRSKLAMKIVGIIIVGLIVIVSILRERIVTPNQNQVTVAGQGKVSYQPDEGDITLGVQIDKAPTANDALNQLNDKMGKVITAVKSLDIKDEDISTQTYQLYPQYDYTNGVTAVSGYNANQNLVIKARDLDKNPDLPGKVISAANGAGVNQVLGVNFVVSNLDELKQKARLKAIADAKDKSADMFKAAGIRAGKIVGWNETVIQSPDGQNQTTLGMGGSAVNAEKAAPVPHVVSGNQEIVIEVGLNYEVK